MSEARSNTVEKPRTENDIEDADDEITQQPVGVHDRDRGAGPGHRGGRDGATVRRKTLAHECRGRRRGWAPESDVRVHHDQRSVGHGDKGLSLLAGPNELDIADRQQLDHDQRNSGGRLEHRFRPRLQLGLLQQPGLSSRRDFGRDGQRDVYSHRLQDRFVRNGERRQHQRRIAHRLLQRRQRHEQT